MTNGMRGLVVVSLVSFLIGIAVAALATTYAGPVTYFGPTKVGGSTQCAKIWSTAITGNPSGALSENGAYYGANCLNSNTVPAGWLGAQVKLIRANGEICGTTPWSFNPSGSSSQGSFLRLPDNASCPAGASYKSSAHAQYWNENTRLYKKSMWLDTPFTTMP